MYSVIQKEKLLSSELANYLKRQEEFILFDTQRKDSENYYSYLFHGPVSVFECTRQEETKKIFQEINQVVKDGFWVAGSINYEAGGSLVEGYHPPEETGEPFLRLGVYEKPIRFEILEEDKPQESYHIENIKTNLKRKDYLDGVHQVLDWISKGEVYQVNFTQELQFEWSGSLIDFYLALRKNQNTSYSALYCHKKKSVLSLSPELFFKKKDQIIFSRPMKGTYIKPLSPEEESKNRAENFMIADLLRNDLGKLCKMGSVVVKEKLKQERFETLSQLTTKIEGIPRDYLEPSDILTALFPSGSVTGAPKKAAMEKIDLLETRERGVYTGSLGFFSPQRDGVFNVAIRTIELSKHTGKMGIGSGLIWDSIPEKEWEECLQKSLFLFKALPFYLFETMLSRRSQFFLKEGHIKRLLASCQFFQIPLTLEKLESFLEYLETSLPKAPLRWKIQCDLQGNLSYESCELSKFSKSGIAKLHSESIASTLLFLTHKSNQRKFYDDIYKEALESGFVDVLFENEKGEITEGCISNVFVKFGNIYYTPPIESGVLPGVFRERLLKRFPKVFKEKVLYRSDFQNAEKVFLCNSVRGIIKITQIKSE
jgi:para-aminobenzoate synthetase / 4-amino-4-deoxychorismate lyase